MGDVALPGLAGAALGAAMEANMGGHMAYLARQSAGMEVREDSALLLIDSGLPSDTFNCICGARLTGRTRDSFIGEAIEHFRGRGLPFAWWVGPASLPHDLGTHLERHGLACTEDHEGMALDMRGLPPGSALPAGVMIRRVADAGDLARFSSVVEAIFDPPDPWVRVFYQRSAAAVLRGQNAIRLYLGCLQGEPVATSVLYLGGGVAGIYDVITLPHARNRGIGTAMTATALHDGHAAGYTTATLQASGAGRRLYTRLGFAAHGGFKTYAAGVGRRGAA